MAAQPAILEFRKIGPAVHVTAIDPVTLIEISFQAPAATHSLSLQRLAAAKLSRAIERAGRAADGRHLPPKTNGV